MNLAILAILAISMFFLTVMYYSINKLSQGQKGSGTFCKLY